ncbi:MAG: WXG100 family type VII secretion target [Propionibacteriaceae bacterium]|nr:WXG100 family type VII secretion target [Propionibacteriaceae bacterium]
MALNATMNVEQIQALAGKVDAQRANLEATLNQLRSSVTRSSEFTGNAAEQYDEYLAKWASAQQSMLEAMDHAGQVLKRYAEHLDYADGQFTL